MSMKLCAENISQFSVGGGGEGGVGCYGAGIQCTVCASVLGLDPQVQGSFHCRSQTCDTR